MNTTQDIEVLWEKLHCYLAFEGMSQKELEDLHSCVVSVLEHLTDIESLNGELLSRAAFWPKDKILHGDDVHVLGLGIANMTGQKAFLDKLRNELVGALYLAQKPSSQGMPND